jgi:tetratricopeptide (TPR) repeat protein
LKMNKQFSILAYPFQSIDKHFKMKKLAILIYIFFTSFITFGGIQPGDSLMSAIAKLPDNKKVTYLLDQIEKTGNLPLQKAIDYAEEGLKYADQIASDADQARLYNFLGNSYYNLGNFEVSLSYYQKALLMVMRIGNKNEIANLMQKMGIIYFNMADYRKALLYLQQTLKVVQEIGNPIREAEIYTHIGSIYYQWNDFVKAFDNYSIALNIYTSLDHVPSIISVGYLKGMALFKQKKYTEANTQLIATLDKAKRNQDKNQMAQIYNTLGLIAMEQQNFKIALEYFNLAFTIHEQISDKIILAQSLNNMGNAHKELGHFEQAAKYFEQSLQIARQYGYAITEMDNYKSYYELFYLQDKPKEALDNYKKYVTLHDSLFNPKNTVQPTTIETYANSNENFLMLKKNYLDLQKSYKITVFILCFIILALLATSVWLFITKKP